ncbi:hypothetical protein Tco_0328819 [Tanacetum coccineum]
MASLDYRLNLIYTIKKCSSCGALYNKSCGCSKWGFVDKFIRDPNKTPDSSQRPPQNCPKCGNPVDGLYCRQCALLQKKLKEVWSTICYEDEIFQDFLNNSESSNDKTNVVNAPQEPFVFNEDPGENSSQRPPHIDHHCYYGCGDSLDVSTISNPEPCHNQNVDEFPQTLPSFHPTCYSGDGSSFTYDFTPNFVDDSPNNRPTFFDDDDDEYIIQYKEYLENSSNAITPDLSTEETDNSLSMRDEHLDTIPKTESDEVIKSSVEDLVPIPSESEGIFYNMCDVPFCDKNHFDTESDLMESLPNRDTSIIYSPKIDSLLEEFAGELAFINPIPSGMHPEEDIRLIEQLLYDDTSSNDDSYEDIDYVDASPPDSELVSLEEVKDFDPEDGEIDTDILLTIKDDILHEKLLNINLLIAKIEALNANQTLSSDFVLKSPIPVKDGDSFLENFETTPELETFKFDIEEKNSGSTTIHADISLPDLECFYFKSEPDPGDLTSIIDPGIRENVSSTTNVNLPFEDDQSPLFAYVVWIFLSFLTIAPDFEASRAHGFVLRSLELHILSFIMGIQYPNLID